MGGLTGCAHGDRSAGAKMDDMLTARRVKGALKDSTVYKFNDVKVNSYNGVVQLSGWVTTDQQKNKATDIAQRVQGVRDVVNNITLTPKTGMGASSSTSQSQTGSSSYQQNQNNTTPSQESERLQQEQTREQQLRDQQRSP